MLKSQPSPPSLTPPRAPTALWPRLTSIAALALMALILRALGRHGWCTCGSWRLWSGEIWSEHNSQHLADPYSLTHVLHGLILYGLLAWLWPRSPWRWRLAAAVALEAAWEVLENSPLVIDRYRAATISLAYYGDSVLNSLGDALFCAAGVVLARLLGLWRSVALFVLIELGLLLWIRDGLLLNLLMLIWPIPALKAWQMPG